MIIDTNILVQGKACNTYVMMSAVRYEIAGRAAACLGNKTGLGGYDLAGGLLILNPAQELLNKLGMMDEIAPTPPTADDWQKI